MQFINYIDDYLIEFWFQPLAHKFQRLTGKDTFFLSYCCCLAFWCIAMFISLFLHPLMGGIVTWSAIRAAHDISDAKRKYYKDNSNQDAAFANANRYDNAKKIRRIVCFVFDSYFFMSILPIIHKLSSWFTIMLIIGLFSHLGMYYFTSCTPLPPGTGLFRKWLDSAVGFFRNLGSGSGQQLPVPVPS